MKLSVAASVLTSTAFLIHSSSQTVTTYSSNSLLVIGNNSNGKCAYYDASGDLYLGECTSDKDQEFIFDDQSRLVAQGGNRVGQCLKADGKIWPKLKPCNLDSDQKWQYTDGKFTTDSGTRCLRHNPDWNIKRLSVGICDNLLFDQIWAWNLATGWDIMTDGDTTEKPITKDEILIVLPFNTSDRDHGALVFTENCTTPFDSETYFEVGTTTPIKTGGHIQFNTTLMMNVTALNNTDYWNAFTDGTKGGWVRACVETYLSYTAKHDLGNGNEEEKVTFLNNILNVSVSLTSDFTLTVSSVNVKREDAKVESVQTDYSDDITAYECIDDDLYVKETGKVYNQGDEVMICVRDQSNTLVQVEEFVNLVVSQTDDIPDYNFIRDGLFNPEITTQVCMNGDVSLAAPENRRVCYAKFRALARFFPVDTPPDLTISGSVFVIRDGRRVMRNLRMALPEDALDTSGRRVQEDNGNGQFELSLVLGLASVDDSNVSGSTIGSTGAGLMSIAVGAAGAALMM